MARPFCFYRGRLSSFSSATILVSTEAGRGRLGPKGERAVRDLGRPVRETVPGLPVRAPGNNRCGFPELVKSGRRGSSREICKLSPPSAAINGARALAELPH